MSRKNPFGRTQNLSFSLQKHYLQTSSDKLQFSGRDLIFSRPGSPTAYRMNDRATLNAATDGAIYRRALATGHLRIDLARLDSRGLDFAHAWLDQLLKTQVIEQVVSAGFEENQQLKHLYFEARNQERLQGNPALGFGYPLLVLREKGQRITAPLFVWGLRLEPSPNRAESWLFTRPAGFPVRYNEWLARLLQERYGYEAAPLLKRVVRDNEITAAELLRCVKELSEALDLRGRFDNPGIRDAPGEEELEGMADPGELCWSGLIGLFPPPWEDKEEQAPPDPSVVPYTGHAFGLPTLDPHQATARRLALTQRIACVEGAPGAGKTRLLLHLLINGLSNGRKTLVVSRSLSALRELQERLAGAGVNQFNFLFRDEVQDKGLLLEMLKAAAEGGGMPLHFDQEHYRILLDKSKRLLSRLDEQYSAVRRPVFGRHTWTETVGLFLQNHREEGKELLSSQLQAADFAFHYDEYEMLSAAIGQSYPLYQPVGTLRHPLTQLHGRIFTGMEKAEGRRFTDQQIEYFLQKASRLQHRYISKTNGYADKLTAYYEHHFRELLQRQEKLEELLADGANRYGEYFDRTGAGRLRLLQVFSEKARHALEARDKMLIAYRDLRERFGMTPLFDFTLGPVSESAPADRVRPKVRHFAKALHEWRSQIGSAVQEEVQRLSHKTVHPRLAYQETIVDLENSLELLVRELNDAALFAEPFANKMLTIPKRQKYLEEIIENLESTKLYLRDFDHFYDWQRNWLSLSEPARKLVRALIKVKPGDWSAAFKSWHLNNVLAKAYSPSLPEDDSDIAAFYENQQRLLPLLVSQILSQWQERREKGFEALRRQDRKAYNLLFSRKEQEQALRNSLAELFAAGLPAIIEALPVMLVTPELANRLFGQFDKPVFDHLFFYEAQDIPYAPVAGLFGIARQTLVCGDPSLQLPGRPRSVLERVKAGGAPLVPLKIRHHWSPDSLYRLAEAEEAAAPAGLHYQQVDGRYDEAEQTNDAEAQQVIHLLNQIKKTPQRTYPNVGIVAFTVGQRDLILDYLLQIKRRNAPGADLIRQLERNGLGVYHLDELTGQRFEVMIVSGAFGQVNWQGDLPEQLAAFDRPEGRPRLELLMSRATTAVHLLSSIPAESLTELAAASEQADTALLTLYFQYFRAVAQNDSALRQQVAAAMQRPPAPAGDPLFLDEVARALAPYLEPGRLSRQRAVAGQTLPLVVYAPDGVTPDLALRGDGFFAATASTEFVWEYRQAQRLEEQHYRHLPVWSAGWWRDSRQEARRLASRLIKRTEAASRKEEP